MTATSLVDRFDSVGTAVRDAGVSPMVLILAVVALILLLFTIRLGTTIARQRRSIRELQGRLHGQHIRRGYAGEALAPLLDRFPVDVGKAGTTTLFVGQPVDYLHFDEHEGVTFIEIKSGSAQLSPRQRRIRELVERGRVRWETMNVDLLEQPNQRTTPDPETDDR